MPNGNNWGGAWPGAGRKKKPLAERLQNGQVAAADSVPCYAGRSENDKDKRVSRR